MIRKIIIFLSLILMVSGSTAYASDPCATFLCLAGKLQGNSGGESCAKPIADYFSIRAFGRHHSFSPGATRNQRDNLINSCGGSSDSPEIRNAISSAYGVLRYQP